MTLEEFCLAIHKLSLSHVDQAIAVLWFLDREQSGASRSPGELARILRDAGLCDPHSTRLGESAQKTGHVLNGRGQLRIKPTSRSHYERLLQSVFEKSPPTADQSNGFLPKAIWAGTRGYIEKVAAELNTCYEFKLYNAASVLLRRLIETLLLECYEHLKIHGELKRADGTYPMLSDIIAHAYGPSGLTLGRETRRVLLDIKAAGDRAAHNRRYVAVEADVSKMQAGARVAVEELLHIAGIK